MHFSWMNYSGSTFTLSEKHLLTSRIGGAGAFTGVGAAILSDASPIASGIMTGTQWAVLGTTYWCEFVQQPHACLCIA